MDSIIPENSEKSLIMKKQFFLALGILSFVFLYLSKLINAITVKPLIFVLPKNFLWAFLSQKLKFAKKNFFLKNWPNIRKPNIRGFTVCKDYRWSNFNCFIIPHNSNKASRDQIIWVSTIGLA